MIVVIDDERIFTDPAFEDAIYLRTADEALRWIAKWYNRQWDTPLGAEEVIKEIWFDHDLGEGDNALLTAALFARLLRDLTETGGLTNLVKGIYIHSQNPVGAARIEKTLDNLVGEHYLAYRVPLPNCTTIHSHC